MRCAICLQADSNWPEPMPKPSVRKTSPRATLFRTSRALVGGIIGGAGLFTGGGGESASDSHEQTVEVGWLLDLHALNVRFIERLLHGVSQPICVVAGAGMALDGDGDLPAVGLVDQIGNRLKRLEHLVS